MKETEGADFIPFLLSFKRVKVELLEGFGSLLFFDGGVETVEGTLVDKITHPIKYYTKMSQTSVLSFLKS